MYFDATQLSPVDLYHRLVGIVTPRPIAWVSSIDANGRANLAPFSFFNVFGANPPIVIFSPVLRRDGSKKDTLLNLEEVGEFVVNAAVDALAAEVNLSARELPRGESEAALAGVTLVPSNRVRPPRVAESPASLECVVREVRSFGDGPIAPQLVIGEVVAIHLADHLLDAGGRIDPGKLGTIGRLGGDTYARTTDRFDLQRPV